MNNERQFKGIWIDKEVWFDTRLNALEKVILMEIDSLDNEESGCYASNKYLAEFCQCSETKISTAISKLIDLGYLYVKSFDGRIRILKSRLLKNERQALKDLKTDIKKVKDNNINTINKNNNINNIKESVKEIFDFWNLQDIIKHKELTDNIVKVIDKTLKEYSVEQVKEYIERYSKVIKNKEYFFKAKWTLTEFLKQKNAMPDFKDDGSKWINYKNRNKKYHKYEERTEYKKEDLDKLYDKIEDINI